MVGEPVAKRVAVGDGRTIQLFGVRFSYKIESVDSGGSVCVLESGDPAENPGQAAGHRARDVECGPDSGEGRRDAGAGRLEEYFAELAPILARKDPPATYYGLAERYGLTIEDDWIEEIEQRYGVKL
jgi:hypothetical protein